MKRTYQLALLAAVVLLAYYPAQFAGYLPIDDESTFTNLQQVKGADLIGLFRPPTSGVGYYRPVLFVSYFFDKYLFDLYPGFMHIENILLHLINVFLVVAVTRRLLPQGRRSASPAPMVAGLFFAVHPLATESVNWISGRTDLLAGAFVLVSTFFLLKYRETGSLTNLAISTAAFLAGVMTKEFAVAFFPAALFLMAAENGRAAPGGQTDPCSPVRRYRDALLLVMIAAAGIAFLLLLRHPFLPSFPRRQQLTLMAIGTDAVHSLLVVLGALGFYVKKLFIPYPLNFSILEVDPLYILLGVPLALFAILCARNRSLPAALATTGLLLLMPSFVIAFGQIAWTPYAERYLYLPLGFFIISLTIFLEGRSFVRPTVVWKVGVAFLLALFLSTTVQRSYLWLDTTSFAADTVRKSPRSRDMRIVYGYLLAGKGNMTGAIEQIEEARRLPMIYYNDKADVMMAHVLDMMGRTDEALQLSISTWERSGGTSQTALRNMISLTEDKLLAAGTAKERKILVERLAEYSALLYQVGHDPSMLYRTGLHAQQIGDRNMARGLFQQAIDAMGHDDVHRIIAQKKLHALEVGL